jgi:pilus assembly protein CpaC
MWCNRCSIGISLATLAASGLLMALTGAVALGQTTHPTAPTEPVVQDAPRRIPTIELTVGQSKIVDALWPAKRVSVTNPAVADVDMTTPRRVQLIGKAVGSSEVTIWSDTGEAWQGRLEVRADLSRLQEQLRKMFANSTVEALQADDVTVIRGTLARAEDAAQLRQLLQLLNIKYLDRTTVAGLQQVQLQVKVAEVSRTAVRYLTTDFAFSDLTTSLAVNNSASGTFIPSTPIGNLTRSLPGGTTIFGTGAIGGTTFEYFVQALADNQYLRILAEPTLVARSGQEASFLAGGQFPIPVANLSGGGGATQISIEYKDFGIQLRFTPTVLGDGKIQLKVAPEVSQLSDVGAVVVLGTRVPSVLSRRVETTLDIHTGQTFAIAGLISQADSAKTSRIPGIGDLPVLGAFFRSVRYSRDETEILVLVTASLVEPTSQDLNPPAPGDFHIVPNDWELYVDGKIEGRPRVRVAPGQQERLRRLGLDQLRGPGAWASYDAEPNTLAGEKQPR